VNLPELRLRRDDAVSAAREALRVAFASFDADHALAHHLLGEAEEQLRHARRMVDKVHAIETWEKYGEES
jgi:hypothetical protein